ncbi:MAG TPA: hypothetical protein VMX96_01730 [Dehalococcoidia bacterium]|nr:hypothetical protein [Dehalococcoidia bacterium]
MAYRVGVSKAIEFCCTGHVIDGKEAYRIGFANKVFCWISTLIRPRRW